MRYLSGGNYGETVITFTAVINIDPKQSEAYGGAVDVYIGLSDFEKAYDILTGAGTVRRSGELHPLHKQY